jgi:hypothetical protein
VLDLLAQGKITAEDAERLLDKLGRSPSAEGTSSGEAGSAPAPPSGGRLKWLRVVVNSEDGEKVNIRVPLSLIRAGIKLRAVMPEHVRRRLEAKGIDLGNLGILEGEDLVEALRELHVDVDSGAGESVRVCCE